VKPFLLTLEEFVELLLGGAPAGVGLGDGVSGKAAEAVEQNALLRLIKTAEALALSVNQSQLGS
jgi:hypothetical protein